jgi:hypothetical protein
LKEPDSIERLATVSIIVKHRQEIQRLVNEIHSYGEIGHVQAIAAILEFPDHYIDNCCENINTNALLQEVSRWETRAASNAEDEQSDAENAENDGNIWADSFGGLYLLPMFDDYRYRGKVFDCMCLYDYISMVYYKKSQKEGVPFEGLDLW